MDDRKPEPLKKLTSILASGKSDALLDAIAECSDARKSKAHRAGLEALLFACSEQGIAASEIRTRKRRFLSDEVRLHAPKLHEKLDAKNFFNWDSRKISALASKAPKHPSIDAPWREKHGRLASLLADTLCEISFIDDWKTSVRRLDCDIAFKNESHSLKNNPQLIHSARAAAEKACEIFMPYAAADSWRDNLPQFFDARMRNILPAEEAQKLLGPLLSAAVEGAHARSAHENWHDALRIAVYEQNIELCSHLIDGLAKRDPSWARHKVHFTTSRGGSHFSWFEYACHEGFMEVSHFLHGIGAHKQLLAESDHFNPFSDLVRHAKRAGTHQAKAAELLNLVALERAAMIQATGLTREQAAAIVEKDAGIESTRARSGPGKAAFDLLALRFSMTLRDWTKHSEHGQPKEEVQRQAPRL